MECGNRIAAPGVVVYRCPVGAVQVVEPSAWADGVHPLRMVLSRWCSRHSGRRLPGWVAPAGHGVTWSRSVLWAGRPQPGKQQVIERIRTNAASLAEGR